MATKKGTKKQTGRKTQKKKNAPFYAVMPVILALVAAFLCMALIHVEWTGVVGKAIRDFGFGLLGGGLYLLPVLLLLAVVFWHRDTENHALGLKTLFGVILQLFFSALIHILVGGRASQGVYLPSLLYQQGMDAKAGGIGGGLLGALLLNCGVVGGAIICIAVLLIFGTFFCGSTPMKLFADMKYLFVSGRDVRESKAEKALAERVAAQEARAAKLVQMQEEHERRKTKRREDKAERKARIDPNIYTQESSSNPTSGTPDETEVSAPQEVEPKAEGISDAKEIAPETVEVPQVHSWNVDSILGRNHEPQKTQTPNTPQKPLDVSVTDIKDDKKPDEAVEGDAVPLYEYPPLSFLQKDNGQMNIDVTAELQDNADKLVHTLESFHVKTRILNVSRGPTITRYELAPEAGTRVRSISNLVDDISLSLATSGVRIESPIPGKAAVGIEVPNKNVATVYVRDLMETEQFKKSKSKLTTCLGMDVAGAPIFLDIAKMPHLLIAGATGMGKSVCINSLIVSMLYKATPNEVKLILIDPKKVELNIYNGIPQLLVPVVSDPKKAAGSLHWAVTEMERRFEAIEEVGVRDITAYNEITKNDPEKEFMSQIVIIIDELADLMMTAPVEVEESICRLAQKARAAGMHLIIGTQRPSVDVITGLIKANIPSRIAFTVASQIDSRTILDIAGAEKLIGRGDMLYAPVGVNKPLRVQGSFVSEKEIEKITTFLKKNAGEIEYDQSVVDLIAKAAELCGNGKKGKGAASSDRDDDEAQAPADPKMKEAIDLAVQNGTVSTSLLQRKLSLGYGRAAKIIDAMENMGFVSAPEGQKPRQVLISRAQWEEMKMAEENPQAAEPMPAEKVAE